MTPAALAAALALEVALGCRSPTDAAYDALPVAAELIEELTAKVAEAHAEVACSGGRIAEAIGTLRDYIDPHATVEGEAVDLLDRTIATQAAEIKRLRDALGYGHPNLRRTDITGTDVHGDGQ